MPLGRGEAEALADLINRCDDWCWAEVLPMGGTEAWVLLSSREAGGNPPPIVDLAAYLQDAPLQGRLSPECRRLLAAWLQGDTNHAGYAGQVGIGVVGTDVGTDVDEDVTGEEELERRLPRARTAVKTGTTGRTERAAVQQTGHERAVSPAPAAVAVAPSPLPSPVRLALDVPSCRGHLPILRKTVGTLLAGVGVPCGDADDVEVLVGELAANAVMHSGADRFLVEVEVHKDEVQEAWVLVVVSDRGRGFPEGALAEPGTLRPAAESAGVGSSEGGGVPGVRFGGWGLPLVRSLADAVEILPVLPHGTAVRAERRVGR